jgi:hypothetical protein
MKDNDVQGERTNMRRLLWIAVGATMWSQRRWILAVGEAVLAKGLHEIIDAGSSEETSPEPLPPFLDLVAEIARGER